MILTDGKLVRHAKVVVAFFFLSLSSMGNKTDETIVLLHAVYRNMKSFGLNFSSCTLHMQAFGVGCL